MGVLEGSVFLGGGVSVGFLVLGEGRGGYGVVICVCGFWFGILGNLIFLFLVFIFKVWKNLLGEKMIYEIVLGLIKIC